VKLITRVDLVQPAMPPGASDPFGNRIELIQDGDGFGQK